MQKEFNQEALAEFDGRDGRPTYIARDGAVYDVSESKLWRNGEHMKRHQA
ncbi:MAG TPA: cytochrome b5, partial [Desulfobacteraceae bacterium]|nr:cytochrome b5 [Desulfobacteraceae bacterium]